MAQFCDIAALESKVQRARKDEAASFDALGKQLTNKLKT